MVTKYLGTEFDIHGGGLDLRFPHHENEMAQSQAAGHGFANFWMHNGMVTYQGEKMSKSIGNTVSPAEMLELAPARVVRYYLGQAHYRSILDYRPTSLQEAAAAVERIEGFMGRAIQALADGGTYSFATYGTVPEAFGNAMDDDLNVPAALAVLHETVRLGNTALTEGRLEEARGGPAPGPRHAPGPGPERRRVRPGGGRPRNRRPRRPGPGPARGPDQSPGRQGLGSLGRHPGHPRRRRCGGGGRPGRRHLEPETRLNPRIRPD